jgi:HD-like signal output (HDOD) protein
MLEGTAERTAPPRPALAAALRAHLSSPAFRPRLLPSVTLELMSLTRDPDADVAKVRSLIESDPLLAAEVLAVARSAHYTTGDPVETIDDAILRIGMERLGSAVLEAGLAEALFRSAPYRDTMDRLRQHSVRVGHVARMLAGALGWHRERAFLAGLLHDIGIGACLGALGALPEARGAAAEETSAAVLACHEEATSALGRTWSMPGAVLWVAGHHHDIRVDGKVRPLQAMVNFADHVASRLGYSVLEEHDPSTGESAAAALGFSRAEVDRVLSQAEASFRRLS